MYCRGHHVQSMEHFGNQTVFIAAVSPLITPDVKESVIQNNTMIFHSAHGLDMKFSELSKKYVNSRRPFVQLSAAAAAVAAVVCVYCLCHSVDRTYVRTFIIYTLVR